MVTTMLDVDRSGMLGAIASLPGQLPDGYERAGRAADAIAAAWRATGATGTPRTMVVCGMGGSGVGADLLPAAIEATAPVVAAKGYDLPGWVDARDRVVCVSYSGNTAETLSCMRQAIERGVVAAVVTSGGQVAELATQHGIPVVEVPAGMQPRAAVGVLFGALVGVAEALGVVGPAGARIAEAAAGAQRVVDLHVEGSVDGDPPALEIARRLHDSIVVVYGCGPTAAVAARWKAQINENAKVPAFANAYPELDHNEIVGWEFAGATGGRWSLVELVPANVAPELRMRMDVTRELIADDLATSLRLDAESVSRAGAVFELVAWGDYVSAYLALVRGVDPSPVERIAELKSRLDGR